MITRNEYSNLINSPTKLTEEEITKIIEMENFFRDSRIYADFIPPFNKEITDSYEYFINGLENFNPLNPNQLDAIKRYKNNRIIIQREKERKNNESSSLANAPKLTLVKTSETIPGLHESKEEFDNSWHFKSAGYTNALAILFVVFNIGIFVAALLLIIN